MKKPDPRIIFALVLVLSSFAVIIREDLKLMAGLMLMSILCALAIGVDFRKMFRRLKRLLQLLLVVSILRSIFAPSGTILLESWGIALLTVGGIEMGALVLLRFGLFLTSGAMLTCYPVRMLIQGMVQIKMPYEIAYMISVGVRFIPQLAEELKDSLIALQLRGVVIEDLKLRKKLSLYTYLLLPVVVSSMQNAKELAMSMDMRAFRAYQSRTSFFKLMLCPSDIVILCVISAFAVFMSVVLIMGV
ncbi:MAG: energy-coupling factor transporter transmembrane protein EcfT [Oscillospiraceae bacterium]|nr:energy-coupling factor transporter transmembrane protein EcfT [Oscillospiraceae bacterium]